MANKGRVHHVSASCSVEEYLAVRANAKAEGKSMSEYLRTHLPAYVWQRKAGDFRGSSGR